MQVHAFVKPPRVGAEDVTRWAVCPETADPVLVKFEPGNYCSDAL